MFNKSIYSIVAKDYDSDPTNSIEGIWKVSKRRILEWGITDQYLEKYKVLENLSDIFTPRLIPNPDYWAKKLMQHYAFFLIKSNSKDYNRLISKVKDYPDLSRFTCYGEFDVILRIVGDEKDIKQVENMLDKEDFDPITLPIQDVPYYYDQEVPNYLATEYKDPDLAADVIDEALKTSATNVAAEIKIELENKKIVLGTICLEDEKETSRIRVFVGVSINEYLTKRKKRSIEKSLIAINRNQQTIRNSSPLTSIYSCGGPPYAYLLEMIFDDQEQLNEVTDTIQEIDEAIDDTVTYIIADTAFAPVKFSQHKHEQAELFALSENMLKDSIEPTIKRLLGHLPNELEGLFKEADPDTRMDVVSLYRELIQYNPNLYRMSDDKINQIMTHFVEFIRGVLKRNNRIIMNAGFSLVIDEVETRHIEFVKSIVENIFYNDNGLFINILDVRKSDWTRWGLAVWGNSRYPNWNNDHLHSAVFEVPKYIMQSLTFVGNARNNYAHVSNKKNNKNLIHLVSETFQQSYHLIIWITDTSEKVINPSIPLRKAKSAILLLKDEMIGRVLVQQEEIIRLLKIMNDLDDVRWSSLSTQLRILNNGQGGIKANTLTIIEELVIPMITERNKPRAKHALAYLKKTAKSLPAEVAATIISGLIANALELTF